MKILQHISKALLILQAIPLLYITALSLIYLIAMISIGVSTFDFISLSLGLSTFFFLISGWAIFFNVLFDGPKQNNHAPTVFWISSFFAAAMCSVIYFFDEVLTNYSEDLTYLGFGIYFVPTLIHLAIDKRLQLHN